MNEKNKNSSFYNKRLGPSAYDASSSNQELKNTMKEVSKYLSDSVNQEDKLSMLKGQLKNKK